MKEKSNLKVVVTEDAGTHKYSSEQVSSLADHLYFIKSTLYVLSCLDTKQPDAYEKGYMQNLALEASIRADKALDIINP